MGAFLRHSLHDNATFFRRDLHHLNGHHIAVYAHIVVKLRLLHVADAQPPTVDFQCR